LLEALSRLAIPARPYKGAHLEGESFAPFQTRTSCGLSRRKVRRQTSSISWLAWWRRTVAQILGVDVTVRLLPEHLLAAAADFLLFFGDDRWIHGCRSATLDRRVSQDWKSIFSICQTQDHLLEDDAFSRDSIWSEVVALK
jgi:hypothetical protein